MKTILVTGGLGFIGSNFLNSYVPNNLDKNIINIDSESYASSFESTKNLTNYNNSIKVFKISKINFITQY